ncbi:type III-B CRISPR module-associated Cmr3 family protein [Thiorhodococcus minor]|uniref:Type III-B CRISPR module-associated protein Cmr3 n=1 Tax=Thiorhodococcus minor TaxID=57489 RepID=A0A6M0K3Y1_9GAMM|nr:type III-B CRISPR module-associated Cmr3 family protein [Thiorhodococcus minor]NEV64430.1 type III-B CRISPR module-associated protein Cmr3 [Thiorhodococcus minor]
MTAYYFVNPTESLFVRGNLAFGDSGEHGVGLMPPPPSLFAGAFRSAMLGRSLEAMSRFAREGSTGDTALDTALGTFDSRDGEQETAGAFRLTWVSLACQHGIAQGASVEAVMPLPADLVRLESTLAPLTPGEQNELLSSGQFLPRVAILRASKQEKPLAGHYLRQPGFTKYLTAETPEGSDCVEAKDLYARDPRLGIGLSTQTGTAESGLIYTTEGFAFNPPDSPFATTGFLVGMEGVDALLPESGFLRLGGDGRSASYQRVQWQPPKIPSSSITKDRRFRLILQTPGLFEHGWLPAGVVKDDTGYKLRGRDFSARLVCGAVPRREVVSGWNLLGWRPKDAQRAAPAGSVYWLEDFSGDADKLVEWVRAGLWGENADLSRRAEGYNLASLGLWP